MSAGEGMQIFFMVDDMLTEVLSIKLASYRYNFSVRTIRQWCEEGKLIAYELDGRWWIPTSELDRHTRRDIATENVAS
jgi:hypothetical protein